MTEPPIHATSVAIRGRAVLILGKSGAGKSDLALRLIDRGAVLVADDCTQLRHDAEGRLLASAPPAIAGRLEVRHLGIVGMAWQDDVPVALAVQLVDSPQRMPDVDTSLAFAGSLVPCVHLNGREPSAPIKVELALARLGLAGMELAGAGLAGAERRRDPA